MNNTQKRLRLPLRQQSSEIIFLIEDSASLSDHQFSFIITTLSYTITQKERPFVRFAILFYHTSTEIIFGFTDNHTDIETRLRSYQRKYSPVASVCLGLQQSNDLYSLGTTSRRKLYVITQGIHDDPVHALQESLILKAQHVEVSTIAVGPNVDKDYTTKFSSPNRAFIFNQNDQLKVFLNEEFYIEIRDYELQLTVHAISYPTGLGEDLNLEIIFKNGGRLDIPIGSEMLFFESDYFYGCPIILQQILKSGSKCKKCVAIPGKGNRNPLLILEFLEFSIRHPNVNLYCSHNAVRLSSEFFIDDFIHVVPLFSRFPYFNILCFGNAGAGKSSFINSLMTALAPNIINAAGVGVDTEHVTIALTLFQLDQIKALENIPIRFFDIWGLDTYNYEGDMLLDVLKGKLPEGFQMKDRLSMTDHMTAASWESRERRIHAVLFIMPYSVFDNPEITKCLEKHFKLCVEVHHMIPLVIVTHAEMAGDDYDQIKSDMAKKFCIPEYSIYMYDNYTSQKEKYMKIDRNSLNVLKHILESCHTYLKHVNLFCPNPYCQWPVSLEWELCPNPMCHASLVGVF